MHKTIAISGSTGGLGRALCLHIARLGGNIIMLDRSKEKADALKSEIIGEYPNSRVDYIRLDLEDFECVKEAVKSLKSRHPDYILLNAGAYSVPRNTTSLGYLNIFQINYLAPYYIARQMLPEIEARGGKIVAVGSIAHNYSKTDDSDIDFSKHARASRIYGNAKRRLMFSLISLGSEHISIAHPGITFTNITAHYPKIIFALIKHPMKIIFMKPKKAALSILLGMVESTHGAEWIGPRFFGIWGMPKHQKLNTCSAEEQRQIAAVSERLWKQLDT